jgi:hypothetical protein
MPQHPEVRERTEQLQYVLPGKGKISRCLRRDRRK